MLMIMGYFYGNRYWMKNWITFLYFDLTPTLLLALSVTSLLESNNTRMWIDCQLPQPYHGSLSRLEIEQYCVDVPLVSANYLKRSDLCRIYSTIWFVFFVQWAIYMFGSVVQSFYRNKVFENTVLALRPVGTRPLNAADIQKVEAMAVLFDRNRGITRRNMKILRGARILERVQLVVGLYQLMLPYWMLMGKLWLGYGISWLTGDEEAMQTFLTTGYCPLPVSHVYNNNNGTNGTNGTNGGALVTGELEYFVCHKINNLLLEVFFAFFWFWNAALFVAMLCFGVYRALMNKSPKLRRLIFERMVGRSLRWHSVNIPRINLDILFDTLTVADIYVLGIIREHTTPFGFGLVLKEITEHMMWDREGARL